MKRILSLRECRRKKLFKEVPLPCIVENHENNVLMFSKYDYCFGKINGSSNQRRRCRKLTILQSESFLNFARIHDTDYCNNRLV